MVAVKKKVEAESKEKSIKEITEILDALELTVNTAGVIMADGEINFSDIPTALKLVNNYETFLNAVKGSSGAIGEAKDLDESEMMAIGLRLFKIISGVKDIVKIVK